MLATDTCDRFTHLVTDNYLADPVARCQGIEPQNLPSEMPLLQDVRKSGAVGTSRFLLQGYMHVDKIGVDSNSTLERLNIKKTDCYDGKGCTT